MCHSAIAKTQARFHDGKDPKLSLPRHWLDSMSIVFSILIFFCVFFTGTSLLKRYNCKVSWSGIVEFL
ncbi:hypothetical protein HanXRQr2_Chr04g0181001 [Helianthus annuus]|uniref:Uncharacterized protein n=1 Tax=Helianthus annuus TaxID=4232 RepID=A0A9K3J9R1_HELAN|nr:hypothetical protein HanXRQr2_Chr04g0181001 [Helianthus annuus]KAJ0932508.1 hypothetical protein HanPSC8_Chr04g0174411 [Helianthus annuus]